MLFLDSIMYDEEIYDKEIKYNRNPPKYINNNHKPRNLGSYQLQIILDKYKELSNQMKWNFEKTLKIIDTQLIRKYKNLYQQYYDFMHEGIFEPNTPTLLNMGTPSVRGVPASQSMWMTTWNP